VSLLVAFLSTPVYQASVLVIPVSGGSTAVSGISRFLRGMGGGGIFNAIGTGSSRNTRAVSLSALSSPYFTRAFIDEQNLQPILFADKWDSENGEWDVADPEDIPTLQEAYDLFSEEILDVFDDNATGLVTVTIDWKDPVLAASWANSLVANANERLRAQTIEDADLTITYLNQELAKTNAVELQQAIYYLVESEIQKKTVAKVQKEYAFQVLSPAVPSDLDKYAEPNRVFIITVGVAFGLFAGIFAAILMGPLESIIQDVRNSESV